MNLRWGASISGICCIICSEDYLTSEVFDFLFFALAKSRHAQFELISKNFALNEWSIPFQKQKTSRDTKFCFSSKPKNLLKSSNNKHKWQEQRLILKFSIFNCIFDIKFFEKRKNLFCTNWGKSF